MTSIEPAADTRRADVQGLRAVAVVAVVLAHVVGWPAGGFAGVDVFFVVSGFLITGLLLRAAEHGRPSLREFYGRRMRRIAPAAVTVLVATTVTAWFLFNQPRFWSTLGDAVAALFFVSNWRFAAEGTDYFHAGDAVSPLQHFWSLSVEEQFYLVWPLVIVLLVVLAARGPARRRRLLIGTVLASVTIASFLVALQQSTAEPTVAYFSTLTRVWELGAGGLLAVAAPLFVRLPVAARVIGGWLGLAGVVAALLLVDDSLPFPGPWAAPAVLATLVVLAAGIGGPQRHLVVLVNPVARGLGAISYALYLWHFPVLVFLRLLMPDQTPVVTALILGLSFALALVSYFLIEQPLHRSPWLRRGPRPERREAWREWRERFGAQFILSSLGVVVIAVAVAVTVQLTVRGPSAPLADGGAGPDTSQGEAGADGAGDADPSAPVNPEDELQAELWAAASSTEWPGDLAPSMDEVIAEGSDRNPANACFAPGDTPDTDSCSWGAADAPHRLYLVGDSTALAYAPAFKALAEASEGQWRVTTIGLYGCRFTEVLVRNDGAGVMQSCPQRKADIAARIAAEQPQLVVMSNAYALGTASDGRPLSTADLVASTLAEAAHYGVPGRVVQLAPPPLGGNLQACYSPVTSPQSCTTGIDQAWTDFQDGFAVALAAAGTGDHLVSSLGFSCAQGYCPAFAGRTPVRYDQVHLTPAYAERIAPALRWELAAQGLF